MRPALSLLLVASVVTSAHADKRGTKPDPIQVLVDEAAKLYEQADLAGALAKLEEAYEESKRPDILFGIGRIHVDRGNCKKAIDVYRVFLESKPKPGPRSTQIATEKIAECQKILGAEPPAPPKHEEVPPVQEEEPDHAEPETRTVRRAWYTDVVGDVLILGGVAGLGAGGWFFLGARSDVDAANTGGAGGVTADQYIELRDRAERRFTYAAIGASIGGALIVGGIVKYVLSDRTEVVPIATETTSGVALRGRF